MKKYVLLVLVCLASSAMLYGQCDDCKMPADDVNDYCFFDDSFPSMCAQFGAKSKTFKLRGEKKFKNLPIGKVNDMKYLKALASDKKLKLSNLELLFVIEGLKQWEIEERKFGYKYEPSGLGIKIIEEGDGDLPEKGKIVEVNYAGYLEDGTKFDSSFDKNETLKFPLGQGRVITGWDEGISKLKKGTTAWLRVPSELGYGQRGLGPIPPNATLYFKIEVIK
ncbi:MAG: FKBP-type peptidyl-prolyl cis-trans isomerase [Cyclobacteriaceae bacterium]